MPRLRAPKWAEDKAKKQGSVDVASIAPVGMVGGLPDGINPMAIREMLRRMGINLGDDVVEAMTPTSKALKDVVERRKVNIGPPAGINDRRYEELLNLFGGRGKP